MKIENNTIVNMPAARLNAQVSQDKKQDSPIFDFDYDIFLDDFRVAKNPYALVAKTLYKTPSSDRVSFIEKMKKHIENKNENDLLKSFVNLSSCFLLSNSQFIDEYRQKMSDAFTELSEDNEDPDNMFG